MTGSAGTLIWSALADNSACGLIKLKLIVYGENNQSLHWICYACARQAKVSGNGRVRSLADILDEGGSTAVDAALDEVSRIAKAQA